MLRKLLVVSLVVSITFPTTSIAVSGPNIQEGRWEVTTQMDMPGMSMHMPPVTHTQCLTKKDFVPQASQQGQECKITRVQVEGSTVTWTMNCSGQGGEMTGIGKVTYRGDSFEGTLEMTMKGSNMKMVNRMRGRRLGDCK